MPSPTKYASISDWKDAGNKQKFLLGKRVTMADEMFRRFRKTPGPATYKTPKEKVKNIYKQKALKNSFIDDVRSKSKEVPAPKYSINFKHVFPRTPFLAKMRKGKSRMDPLSKSNAPGPGAYKTEDSAFRKEEKHY